MHKLRKLRSRSPMPVGGDNPPDPKIMEQFSPVEKSMSTPDKIAPAKKKRKPFFHRYRHNKNDNHLNRSVPLPAGQKKEEDPLLLLQPPSHISLDSSWGGYDSVDSPGKEGSLYSSNSSLLSVELSDDEEFVESLVNPQGLSRQTSTRESSPHAAERRRRLGEGNIPSPLEYTVNITLMSGHGLAIRDKTGSSDPYVKFKCPPFKYRSATIHRNLNPEWNEHFSFRTERLDIPMSIRVCDYDFGSMDDFMGGHSLDLSAFAHGNQHTLDLGLEDPSLLKAENLGFIRIFIKIVPYTEIAGSPQGERVRSSSNSSSSPTWDSVLEVTLLSGKDLPAMDQNGLSDPYCKFKLGSQKYKSKVISKTLNPEWREKFDLRIYNNKVCNTLHVEVWDRDFPQNDDYIGGCSVDLCTLTKEVTHTLSLPLVGGAHESNGIIRFMLCVMGTGMQEETNRIVQTRRISYNFLGSFNLKAIRENYIGRLRIKIDKVVDLVPCNSYVWVELGNSFVRTHKVGKTADPVFDKTFEFTVRDIHDVLEIQVHKSSSKNILGYVKIPLLRLEEGVQQFALKDKDFTGRARGIIYIETELVYNPFRAMIKTINPKERELDEEQKLKKKILLGNIKRVANLVRTCLATLEFIKSTWTWENKTLSAGSFLIFLFVTIFGQLWWLFAGCVAVFMYQYLTIHLKNGHINQNKVSGHIHSISQLQRGTTIDNDSDSSDDMDDDKHSSLREKFHQFQTILILVQNVMGYIADMEERIRNLLSWRVPFLGWMAVYAFIGGTVLLYLVPLRYIILVWGINKYTKRLRKPNFISNNELLDFLSRCPSNAQLEQWREIPLAVFSEKKKIR